jgi:hypothetical protein
MKLARFLELKVGFMPLTLKIDTEEGSQEREFRSLFLHKKDVLVD